ncbi:MAG: hypothetical protein ACHREM_14840 [Polyangiales bacterium]
MDAAEDDRRAHGEWYVVEVGLNADETDWTVMVSVRAWAAREASELAVKFASNRYRAEGASTRVFLLERTATVSEAPLQDCNVFEPVRDDEVQDTSNKNGGLEIDLT